MADLDQAHEPPSVHSDIDEGAEQKNDKQKPCNNPNEEKEVSTTMLGKKALRRQKRQAIWVSVRERKRLKKEEKRREMANNKIANDDLSVVVPEVELDMSEGAVRTRKDRSIMKRESFLMATNEGPTIVIDCGFEEDMQAREKKSLSQQIMFVTNLLR
jgi:Trm5-related predicted tRNA methylase